MPCSKFCCISIYSASSLCNMLPCASISAEHTEHQSKISPPNLSRRPLRVNPVPRNMAVMAPDMTNLTSTDVSCHAFNATPLPVWSGPASRFVLRRCVITVAFREYFVTLIGCHLCALNWLAEQSHSHVTPPLETVQRSPISLSCSHNPRPGFSARSF